MPEEHSKDRPDAIFRHAIARKDLPMVRALIEDGLNITSIDADGKTPLMVAAQAQSPEIVDLLLKNGADPSLKDNLGYTAEMIAYWYGEGPMGWSSEVSQKIVQLLRNAG
jgi:ankyrin repeat protein